MSAYYNEIDPYAAQWLRNLIAAGEIAPGVVDERSIEDVLPDDLKGFTQCHFFAGIGGWSIALRQAGWADDRPVWTGSCPCQPFSAAGAGKAADDERHLWPAWFSLIAQRRPAIVFGEQVEAAIGWGWLDAVFADLEKEGYACGASVLPACGVGAPHIRNRLWFVGHANGGGKHGQSRQESGAPSSGQREVGQQDRQRLRGEPVGTGADDTMANANGGDASPERQQRSGQHGQQPQDGRACELAYAGSIERERGPSEQRSVGASSPQRNEKGSDDQRGGADGGMADTNSERHAGTADRTWATGGASLQNISLKATWPTPRAEESESSGTRHSRGVADTLTAVSGLAQSGSPAQTESPGQLDPDHSRWLMGYSAAHLSCAPMETPSSLKSRRNLSWPMAKP